MVYIIDNKTIKKIKLLCSVLERIEADKVAKQSQVLWSACQALHRAVKSSTPGLSWREQIKPLQKEIDAIKKAASKFIPVQLYVKSSRSECEGDSDELVAVVLAAIPEEARVRGVYPEDAIRERFLKVEKVAKKVALVPADGGRLPLFFLSFLQSFFLLKADNPIPQAELEDEQTDFAKLDTYDILQRAR